ncbi:squalene/phytoene synthase family protein [uncultured Corynebacterium sp.]|uniref:phytoene/squalene synthase family protein n=1 Tax=uncultured Corynebacterium sp. TaxID=159447 RepID=UPI00288B9EED|nr:squalene/phytoene synthase family protein [uncultured Corynebacterium sp.]
MKLPHRPHPSPAEKYATVAQRAAAEVIRGYSTSFSMASSLLREPVRTHVRNLYAMVRVADEVVDGVAAGAGLNTEATRACLDAYEQAVYQACDRGFSTDLVLHAFARTANECGLEDADLRDFFTSMRQDTLVAVHDAASVDSYVHGSAEVIGLMCNAIFAADSAGRGRPWSAQRRSQANEGALALGRAFQKVNFLRDMAEDTQKLGRNYVSGEAMTDQPASPGDPSHTNNATSSTPRETPAPAPLTAQQKADYIADIRADLALANSAISLLPATARAGVAAAHALFAELTELLDQASVEEIMAGRIRVSAPRKAAVTARAAARAWRA